MSQWFCNFHSFISKGCVPGDFCIWNTIDNFTRLLLQLKVILHHILDLFAICNSVKYFWMKTFWMKDWRCFFLFRYTSGGFAFEFRNVDNILLKTFTIDTRIYDGGFRAYVYMLYYCHNKKKMWNRENVESLKYYLHTDINIITLVSHWGR